MAKSWIHAREWLLVSMLLVACVSLGFLQYRWTGELSRAETARLRASAGARARQVARTFDQELQRAVNACLPAPEEVRQLGIDRANAARLREAAAGFERPYFRRIAAAVPTKGGLEYHEASLTSFEFSRQPWPEAPEWQALRSRLEAIARGAPVRGPVIDPATVLIEVPIFVEGTEAEWLLFEADDRHATATWLPELVREFINTGAEPEFEVAILRNPGLISESRADELVPLFPVGFRGGRGGRGREYPPGRWLLSIRHVTGSVDEAAAASRRRNLAVAAALLVLIATAGSMLVRHAARARALSDAQFQFFAGLSHELRTPLTVIQGAGHNLLSGVVKDEHQRESYAKAIVKQSAQLTEMVDQMLSYAGLRKGSSAQPRPVSISVCISEAIEAASQELGQAGRSADADVPPDLPAVHAIEDGLRRALTNLISNAIRHGGGDVSITARCDGAFVEVRVADSGPGIPADEMRQVFDPFFRGQRARAGRVRGTGLGLSLVKETVESSGGSVSVESSPDRGAVFTLRLRVAP